MSETKHTPGPLHFSKDDGNASREGVYGSIRDEDGTVLADIWADIEELEPVAMGNGLLFAAAPDMLIALKAFSLFSAMIGKDGRPSWFKDDGAWTEFVIADEYRKAAIAKAGTQ